MICLLRIMPFLLFIALSLSGCVDKDSGPPSVVEGSDTRANLTDRIRFVENYVRFRRGYKELDYVIAYQNNSGGMVPGPSDWDIRLVAVVPSTELDSWVPVDADKIERNPPQWLLDLPGSIPRDSVTEWYLSAKVEVGVDREQSIVAYRNTSSSN